MTSLKSRTSQKPPSLLRSLWLKSQTKYVAYTQGLSAALLAGLDQANGIVSDHHFKAILDTMTVDKKIYIGLAVLSFVTWLAHGRESDA